MRFAEAVAIAIMHAGVGLALAIAAFLIVNNIIQVP